MRSGKVQQAEVDDEEEQTPASINKGTYMCTYLY